MSDSTSHTTDRRGFVGAVAAIGAGVALGEGTRAHPSFVAQQPAGANLQRRKLLTGLAAGAAVVPLMRSTPGFGAERDERLLRPPGSVDEEFFLARCIRCGECMKVCPNNALQPALSQAGLEGLWTPVLVPRIGYCETSCVLCSQVCPTGAITRRN